jgi:hypothetical protein
MPVSYSTVSYMGFSIVDCGSQGVGRANEPHAELRASTRVCIFFFFQKSFRVSPDTEGRNGESLSTERRSRPLATATDAMTLAASLYKYIIIIYIR